MDLLDQHVDLISVEENMTTDDVHVKRSKIDQLRDQGPEIAFKNQDPAPVTDSNTPGFLSKENADWFRSLFGGVEITASVSQRSDHVTVMPVSTQDNDLSKESMNDPHVERFLKRKRGNWLPALGTEFLPAAEYCYEAQQICSEIGYHKKDKNKETMRKHLSSTGWRIEYKQSEFGTKYTPIFRYIAPNGKTVHSLLDACEYSLKLRMHLGRMLEKAVERKLAQFNSGKSRGYSIGNLKKHGVVDGRNSCAKSSPFDVSEKRVNFSGVTSFECAGTADMTLPETKSSEPHCHMEVKSCAKPSPFAVSEKRVNSSGVNIFECARTADVNLSEKRVNSSGVNSFQCARTADMNLSEKRVNSSGVNSFQCARTADMNLSEKRVNSSGVNSFQCARTADMNLSATKSSEPHCHMEVKSCAKPSPFAVSEKRVNSSGVNIFECARTADVNLSEKRVNSSGVNSFQCARTADMNLSEKRVNSSGVNSFQCARTADMNLSATKSSERHCHMEVESLEAIKKQGSTADACNSCDKPPEFSNCDGKDSIGVDSFQFAGKMDLNLPEIKPPPENPVFDVQLDCNNSRRDVLERVDAVDDCNSSDKLPLSDISQEKLESVVLDSSQCVQTTDLNLGDTYRPHVNPASDGVDIEPEYCPQAVIDWIDVWSKKSNTKFANQNDMSLKAKKHLLAVGWKLSYITKMKVRRELRYTSPKGKTHISLVKACETCIKQEMHDEKPQSTVSGKKMNDPPSVHQESSQDGRILLDDRLEGSCQTSVSRSQKRVREILEPNLVHYAPQNVLSCLIDNNVIHVGAKVYIKARKGSDRMFEGQICSEGVKCKCCDKVYSLTKFEAHAGSISHQPAANIVLEDGLSLLECQKKLAQVFKQKISLGNSRERIKRNQPCEKNDHICSVCNYGGDLVLCDQCPSAFHLSCLGLNDLPNGQWFCPSCRCGICNGSDFNGNTEEFRENTVLYCDQCEREYHVGCIRTRQNRQMTLESLPKETWFCSEKCEQIFVDLHKLLGTPIAVGDDNLTWTILKSSRDDYLLDSYASQSAIEDCCKLTVALGVMHECFEPMKGLYNNNDLVEDLIFNKWSELNRMNFWGFYTVLLEQDDELVSVAAVRIYGGKVAEIPLVGTRFKYRRQGMCHRLMNVLEKKLAELGVERLVLPAVPQVLDTWTTKFGFSKMTAGDRLKFVEHTFLDFQDTTMCHKFLNKSPNLLEKSGVAEQIQGPNRARRRGPPRRPRLHFFETFIPRGVRRRRSSITSRRRKEVVRSKYHSTTNSEQRLEGCNSKSKGRQRSFKIHQREPT